MTALLVTLMLAAPGAKFSYKKKVMVDPDYRPTLSKAQIDKTLRPPAPRKVTYRKRVYVPARAPQRPRFHWGISVGFPYGSISYSPEWGVGVGVHVPWPGYGYGGHHRSRYYR